MASQEALLALMGTQVYVMQYVDSAIKVKEVACNLLNLLNCCTTKVFTVCMQLRICIIKAASLYEK